MFSKESECIMQKLEMRNIIKNLPENHIAVFKLKRLPPSFKDKRQHKHEQTAYQYDIHTNSEFYARDNSLSPTAYNSLIHIKDNFGHGFLASQVEFVEYRKKLESRSYTVSV